MITTSNEFETVAAFTHIAGCELGTWTDRETTIAMVKVLDQVSNYDTASIWREIAETTDDSGDLLEIQQEIADLLNEYMPMPESCSVSLQDNEWRVLPYIDDCLPKYSDYPDDYTGSDTILVVNDHGNVTCQHWNDSKREYETQWAMV